MLRAKSSASTPKVSADMKTRRTGREGLHNRTVETEPRKVAHCRARGRAVVAAEVRRQLADPPPCHKCGQPWPEYTDGCSECDPFAFASPGEPFCACGRRAPDCDGSRAACPKAPASSKPRSQGRGPGGSIFETPVFSAPRRF